MATPDPRVSRECCAQRIFRVAREVEFHRCVGRTSHESGAVRCLGRFLESCVSVYAGVMSGMCVRVAISAGRGGKIGRDLPDISRLRLAPSGARLLKYEKRGDCVPRLLDLVSSRLSRLACRLSRPESGCEMAVRVYGNVQATDTFDRFSVNDFSSDDVAQSAPTTALRRRRPRSSQLWTGAAPLLWARPLQ